MHLLDSQVVLRLANDNPRLGRGARNRIENADIAYVSAAIWELTIKKMLGKLDLPDALSEWHPAKGSNRYPTPGRGTRLTRPPSHGSNRYPTPGSVIRYLGCAGSGSNFRRSCARYTRR